MKNNLEKKIKQVLTDGFFEKWQTSCLSDETLTELIENKISGKSSDSLHSHLISCDDCLDLFITTGQVLNSEKSTTTYYNKFKQMLIVVKLLPEAIKPLFYSPGFTLSSGLYPVSVRGKTVDLSRNQLVFVKEKSPFLFKIFVERIGEKACNIQVQVRKFPSKEPADIIRLSLFNENHELESSLTEDGEVSFDDILAGKYLIKVADKGHKICEFNLIFK